MQDSSPFPLPARSGSERSPFFREKALPGRRGRIPRETRPEIPEVERQLECPYTARLFLMHATDVAARCVFSSQVLGLPPAVMISTPTPETAQENAVARVGSSVGVEPVKMYSCPIWRDTSLTELSFAALRQVRMLVDKQFAALHHQNEEDSAGVRGVGSGATVTVGSRRQTPPAYLLEWFVASVTMEGKAGIEALGAVELHQVVQDDERTLLPVRRKEGVHYNTLLMHLPYRLGDPLLFTCTRLR